MNCPGTRHLTKAVVSVSLYQWSQTKTLSCCHGGCLLCDAAWPRFARMCVCDSVYKAWLKSIDLYVTDNRRSLLSENHHRCSHLCAPPSRGPESSASRPAASQQQLHCPRLWQGRSQDVLEGREAAGEVQLGLFSMPFPMLVLRKRNV